MSYTQTIYNVLRKRGLTQAAALGMLGNWWCESNCERSERNERQHNQRSVRT